MEDLVREGVSGSTELIRYGGLETYVSVDLTEKERVNLLRMSRKCRGGDSGKEVLQKRL